MIAEISTVLNIADKAIDLILGNDVEGLIKKGKLGLETNGSITKLIAETIIDCPIIVSKSLETNADIDKILNFNVDVLAATVSQAFVVLTKLKGIDPNTAFDVLKTNKTVTSGLNNDMTLSIDLSKNFKESKGLTLGKANPKLSSGLEAEDYKKDKSTIPTIYSKDIDLKLTFKDAEGKEKHLVLPILFKAKISFLPYNSIKTFLVDKNFEKDAAERWLEKEAGIISAWNFWFPMDMIKAYKEKKIRDTDELMAYTSEKSSTGYTKILTSGMTGFGMYLGGVVLTIEELEDIETTVLRGNINDDKRKDKFFEAAKSTLLTIVDGAYDRVRVVTKDVGGSGSVFKIANLKKKTDGSDLDAIFKDILLGKRF